MKSFIKAFFTITLFSFLTKLLSFVLKIFLSREIGAEAIGMFQVAMSICMVFVTLSSSGLNVIVSKKTSENLNSNKEEKTFPLVTACILLSLIISGISITLILLFSKLIKNFTSDNIYTLLLYMLPCLISVSISCGLNGYFWGRKNHFANSFSEFLEQFLRNILCLILITTTKNPISGAILATISMSIACTISTIHSVIMYIKSGGKFKKPCKEDFSYLLKSSLPITFVRFINSFTHPIIAIIVPLKLENIGFTSSQAISMFGIMQGMTLPLIFVPMMLISALSTVLIPDLVSFYSRKCYRECNSIVNLTITFSLFISFLAFPLFTSVGNAIGEFLFDNINCGIYLTKSAWIMIPNAIFSISSAILNVLDLEKKASKNFIIGTILLVILAFVLPNYFDIMSIPLSMGISISVSSLLNLIVIKKELNFNPPVISTIFKFLLISIPTHILTFNVYEILIRYFTLFYSLMICCCLGVLFYFLLCIIFKIIDIRVVMSFKTKSINYRKNNKKQRA